MQLSKLEDKAYQALKKNNLVVFTIRDLCLVLDIDKVKAYNIIKSLKKKDAVKTIVSGKYSFNDVDEFIIGNYTNWPSYVSFLSALNYYGFSDNVPNEITYATTKNSKKIDRYRYVHVASWKFFGYVSVNEIVIADKEKAFIDSLMIPSYSLGIKHILDCFEKSQINKDRIASYAIRLGIKAVIRRLGWMLEEAGVEEKYLRKLSKHKGKGIELLDPSMDRSNKYNKRWLLDVNLK